MKEKAYYIVSKARQILGGTISADQCRDYVLALLFLKSASEYYKSNNSFQQDDNSPALRLLVSERSSFDYLCKELDSPELGRLINMALYELEQVNALVTEGYEINKAIDFESNILGDMNARSIKKNRKRKTVCRQSSLRLLMRRCIRLSADTPEKLVCVIWSENWVRSAEKQPEKFMKETVPQCM